MSPACPAIGDKINPPAPRLLAMTVALKQELQQGLQALQLTLSGAVIDQLLSYLQQLERWNGVYNLTAVSDRREMIHRHLLDSLSGSPYLHGSSALDIGSGAGLPGIPLALANPHIHFFLLDSHGRKIRFLSAVKLTLGIPNIQIWQGRLEDYRAKTGQAECFSTLLLRAVAPTSAVLTAAANLCTKPGRLLLWRGKQTHISPLPDSLEAEFCQPVQWPGLQQQRHLLALRRGTG